MLAKLVHIKWGYLFIVILVFLAAPLRFYFPTSFILELLVFVVSIYYSYYGKMRSLPGCQYNGLYFSYIILLFICGIILGYPTSIFFNENYRFFFFYIFLFVFLVIPFDFRTVVRYCYICCLFHVFFTFYEIIYLNILAVGKYENIFLVGKAMSLYAADSQYLQPQWEFGFPFIRPFGLMLQPQKSGFVMVLGIILRYVLDNNSMCSKSRKWYWLFLLSLLCTGAKTAILIGGLIYCIIQFNLKFQRRMSKIRFFVYSLMLLVFLFSLILLNINMDHVVFSDVINDTTAFFNYPWYNILFGIGIPDHSDLLKHDFVCECFFARVLAQVGIINALFLILISSKIMDTKDKQLNLIICILMFGLLSHYCIINVYFISFTLAMIICYSRNLAIKNECISSKI